MTYYWYFVVDTCKLNNVHAWIKTNSPLKSIVLVYIYDESNSTGNYN